VASDPSILRDDWRNTPHPRRLAVRHPHRAEILARHAAAMELGLPVYTDPVSRLSVFTAEYLARRSACCDSGCRHCPYTT